MGFLSGLLGGGSSKVNAPATPSYYTDPNFDATQAFLKNYSEQGLQGNMPDWYKQIGEAMPADMYNGVTGSLDSSIIGASNERDAIRGTGRGGALSADTMNALGNQNAQLKYSDWVRAMSGRQGLMNTFLGTEGVVGANAYKNQTDKNTFDQWKYGADLSQEQRRAANAGTGISNLLKLGGGALGFMAGGPIGGLVGSQIGGSINGGGGGGGIDMGSIAKTAGSQALSGWLQSLFAGGGSGAGDIGMGAWDAPTMSNSSLSPTVSAFGQPGTDTLNFGKTSNFSSSNSDIMKLLYGGN